MIIQQRLLKGTTSPTGRGGVHKSKQNWAGPQSPPAGVSQPSGNSLRTLHRASCGWRRMWSFTFFSPKGLLVRKSHVMIRFPADCGAFTDWEHGSEIYINPPIARPPYSESLFEAYLPCLMLWSSRFPKCKGRGLHCTSRRRSLSIALRGHRGWNF